MSITPPSDIVLDVARAADPARYQDAVAKLSQPGSAGATAFADAARDVGLSTEIANVTPLGALEMMQAAMTGHLVFSTVHARDTIGSVFRPRS
jgi:hypothetical protein